MLAAAALLLAPAAASASTVGVANLEGATVSNAGVLGQPPNYSVWSSGWRDNTPEFYASEAGFLTEVSIAHWNNADVTVKIFIFRRGSGDTLSVAAVPMTMLLPATAAPGVVRTQAVTTPTEILAGDRIGLTVVSGGSTLHALNDNFSAVIAQGVYAVPAPPTEPGVGSSYNFTSGESLGPLIRGRVSATPGSPPGGGSPGAVVQRTTPLTSASGPTKNLKGKGGGVEVLLGCADPKNPCIGHAYIQSLTGARSAAGAPLGSAPYNIPGGTSQKVSIPLTKAARSKLGKKGKLSASLVLSEQVGGTTVTSSTPVTIKGAKKKKKK
jgi:hypothetical protein